jgi:hypothetical protein
MAIGAALIMQAAMPTHAVAQERRSPSILEFLGIRPAKPKVIIKPTKPARKKLSKAAKPTGRKKPSASAEIAAAKADLPPIPDKALDAKTVLVIGDFMAGGLSEGLNMAFEQEAGIRIIDKSSGSSGFVRDDVYNWPQNLGILIAETKPSVLVAMIGTNDRQQMMVNGVREATASEPWNAEYDQRVTAFADAAKASGVPLVWVGLPPFKQQTMSAGILAFNDLYRKKSEKISGSFVDIWDGFLDDQGMFTINGVDHTGQPAKLRSSDGINLTKAGRRKVAFFAEKPIRVALGALPQQTPISALTGPFALPGPMRPVAAKRESITSMPPISMFDPAFDGGTELLGGPSNPPQPGNGQL